MIRPTHLCLALLLGLLAAPLAPAAVIIIDPLTQAQFANTSQSFTSGLGDTIRTLQTLGSGGPSLSISSGQVSGSGGSTNTLLQFYTFNAPTDFTAFDALLLGGVTPTGSPQFTLTLADINSSTQTLSLINIGSGNYAADIADFNTINLTSIARLTLGYTNPGGSFAFTATSLEVVSSVPEPATWSMLILGSAALLLRPRQKSPA